MGQDSDLKRSGGVSIVLCGQAGTGIQTVERLLTKLLKLAGYNVFATKEYMSRVRGGTNSTEIRVGSKPVRAFVNRIDVLIALNAGAVEHLKGRISGETVILGEHFGQTQGKRIEIEFSQIAKDIGNKIYANIAAVGTLATILDIDAEHVEEIVSGYFGGKAEDVVKNNVAAAKAGFEKGKDLVDAGRIKLDIEPEKRLADEILVNGAQSVALGAIAGGCNFIGSYPMSPSTAVLAFLAKQGREHGIITEQAEDEIAAINMAIGAWYAGARGMVTTSGGGFALMSEGLSLAAMLESPVVIHLAQRPGPATGLPTRTEQGDLNLALYAGHGEFPRIILAPGTPGQAFDLSRRAFNLADKYQVPVFILTDQYLMDTYYNTEAFDVSSEKVEHHFIETEEDYKRYEFAENGVSPRGIPGHGKGLVVVDSDEHNQEGHITEDFDVRVKMVDKRLAKGESLKADAIEPELVGPDDFKNLVVCWGSTREAVAEALDELDRDDTAMLHFTQVWPVPQSAGGYLAKARRSVIVENNATGQFAALLKQETGTAVDEKILKYNGLAFNVEELVEKIGQLLD